jgi:sugar transferase (PEP-CTERM system associated)
VLIGLSLVCAVKLRFWNDQLEFQVYTTLPGFAIQAAVIMLIFQTCFYFNDLYDLNAVRRMEEGLVRLGQSIGAGCLLVGLISFLVPGLLIGRGVFFISILLVVVFIVVSRVVVERAWRVASLENLVIVGTGELALTVARELAKRRDLNFHLAGFVDETPGERSHSDRLFGHAILGSTAKMEAIAEQQRVSRIIVALEDRRGIMPTSALVRLRVQGVIVEDAHTSMTALTGRVWLRTVRPSWFVFSEGFHRSRVSAILKRAIDLCFGLAGFVISAPIMVLVAAAIKLDSHGPVLYRQTRVGWRGRHFEVLKFRSMRLDAEAQNGAQWAVEDDPRVTRTGRFLRKFRLDELPQFINVLRGEMSFVGPRPERPVFVQQLRQAIPYYDERHSVRPGITGWAQVQYGYGASIEDAYRKLEYDLFYLENMSVLFDCAIIFKTIRIVFGGRGGR